MIFAGRIIPVFGHPNPGIFNRIVLWKIFFPEVFKLSPVLTPVFISCWKKSKKEKGDRSARRTRQKCDTIDVPRSEYGTMNDDLFSSR